MVESIGQRILGLGLAMAAIVLLAVAPQRARGQSDIEINEGISTTLAEAGLNGPDFPHDFHPDEDIWEFDGSDGGGRNFGLLWFDIPSNVLSGFEGAASLQLYSADAGDPGFLHRVTEDWVSTLGDQVTWNEMPGGHLLAQTKTSGRF